MTATAIPGLEGLPEHRRVLDAVVDFFRRQPGAIGLWVGGSLAEGLADEHSDLDVEVLFADAASRDEAWEARWAWEIAPWFHRFDADHVRDRFVIYLYEPEVKCDVVLALPEELKRVRYGAVRVLWDETGALTRWAEQTPERDRVAVDWSNAWHEDERFWAWTYYLLKHAQRGEYYEVATYVSWLREIVEAWHARLRGEAAFEPRRAEQRGEDLTDLAATFAEPTASSIKAALLKLIEIHDRQRARLDLPWRTTDEARRRIRTWVEEL